MERLNLDARCRPLRGAVSLLATLIVMSGAYASGAAARLTEKQVIALAEASADSADFRVNDFNRSKVSFDPVTRVWQVAFSEKKLEGLHANTFSVFVQDSTSQTEVNCLGMEAIGQGQGANFPAAELPPKIRPFVPENQQVKWLYCADVNGDGLPDYVLVTEGGNRTLQILLRGSDGNLRSDLRNDEAVQGLADDEFNGAPALIVRKNRFVIINNSAGHFGSEDTHEFYFEYSPQIKTWILMGADRDIKGAQPEDAHSYHQSSKDFGRVTIGEFTYRKFP